MTGDGPVDDVQGTQLQLGFSPPSRPVTVGLTLSGLQVVADGWASQTSLAWEYLIRVGVEARVESGRGIVFPMLELHKLAALPSQVTVAPDVHLQPIVTHLRSSTDPAVVDTEVAGGLTLSGVDDDGEPATWPLTVRGAVALLAADVPFVATADAWEYLDDVAAIPLLLGRARVTLDRYVEITTSKPQLVESSPLPALWRIDDTRFGVPLAYADMVDGTAGFTWDGPRPRLPKAPRFLPPLPFTPVRGQGPDVRTLVDRLASQRAAALLWPSGLGRRVHALAAVELLGLHPLLVVSPDWAVWLWRRHSQMVGHPLSLRPSEGDIRLVTYRDLAVGAELEAPTSILFDSPTATEASVPAARAGLRTLDAFAHAYRVVVDRSWPSDEGLQDHLACLLRPAEFVTGLPRGRRYPLDPDERRQQHQQVYLLERDDVPEPSTSVHQSNVQQVELSELQRRQLDELTSLPDRRERLARHLQVLEVGSETEVAPKLSAAVRWAYRQQAAGVRAAIVTFQQATVSRLRLLLTGMADGAVTVVGVDGELPDLTGFGAVLLLSYPWSASEIDRACGQAGTDGATGEVTVLHTPGSVDDRLALLSVRRGELSRVQAAGLSDAEVDELLQPRTLW